MVPFKKNILLSATLLTLCGLIAGLYSLSWGRAMAGSPKIKLRIDHQNDGVFPSWMPASWQKKLTKPLQEIQSQGDFLEKDLASLAQELLQKSSWIESVEGIYRDFDKGLMVSLSISEPIALIKKMKSGQWEARMINRNGRLMPLLSSKDQYTLNEKGKPSRLPTIFWNQIKAANQEVKNSYLSSILSFIFSWNQYKSVTSRLSLIEVQPAISATSKKYLTLYLSVLDKSHQKKFFIEWGVCSKKVNSREQLNNQKKFKSLIQSIQNIRGPMRQLDLRYKETSVFFPRK